MSYILSLLSHSFSLSLFYLCICLSQYTDIYEDGEDGEENFGFQRKTWA